MAFQLKFKDGLGIIAKLPETTDYVEITLSTAPLPVTYYQTFPYCEQLRIAQVWNLVISDFDNEILPTVAEVHELLGNAVRQLQESKTATTVF